MTLLAICVAIIIVLPGIFTCTPIQHYYAEEGAKPGNSGLSPSSPKPLSVFFHAADTLPIQGTHETYLHLQGTLTHTMTTSSYVWSDLSGCGINIVGDAPNTTVSAGYGFILQSNSGIVSFYNITFQTCDSLFGGAIRTVDSNSPGLGLFNVKFNSCTADIGGAVYVQSNVAFSLNVTNTEFNDCLANGSGGSMYIDSLVMSTFNFY